MVGHSFKKGRTLFLSWIIVAISLLQNGPLNNLPIILLILMLPTLKKISFRKPGQCEKAALFYGLYLLFITFLNIGSNFNINYSINILIQYTIIYICLKLVIHTIDTIDLLLFIRNFGIVVSILCLIEALSNRHIWAFFLGKMLTEGSARVVGIFNHPIVCACFLLIALILTIVFPFSKRNVQIITIICIASAIVLTQSRSTWIATLLILFTYLLKFHSRKINKTYFAYILTIAAIVIIASIVLEYNIVGTIITFVNERIQGTLEAGEGHIVRIEIILNSFEYWKNDIIDFVFGRGKNYGLLYLEHNPIRKFGTFTWSAAIDNQYITLIYETGLIGLMAILYIIAVEIRRFIKSTKSDKIQIAMSLCLIGNATCLFFYEGLNYPVMVLFCMIFILISDSNNMCAMKQSSLQIKSQAEINKL